MKSELTRRNFLNAVGAVGAVTVVPAPMAQLLRASRLNPSEAVPASSVVRGNARFQILSSGVVRMEYAPTGRFVDATSVAVLNRSWPACPYTAHDVNGWLEIATEQLRLRYQLGSGAFGKENLVVTWQDDDGEHSWRPGAIDDKNLGGVPGEIPGRKAAGNEPGPLSRNGYFWLDDSTTAIWNSATQWPEPRPTTDGQDWYLFVYGRDYKRFFREATMLFGSIPMIPRYMLGTWFGSRAGYPADECQRICLRFREEQIPLDIFVLTSDTDMKIIWAGYDWDDEQFPDPKGFFRWAKAHGIKTTTAEHYRALTPINDSHFEQIRQALGLPAGTKEIHHDLANKKYAQLFMDLLHKPALQEGMDFWWQDGAAESSMPGLDATLWTRWIEYEGQERITGKRAFVFCRLRAPDGVVKPPAWGVHRYGSFFTGDLTPYWSTLELLVPFNVQSGNMMVPYVNNLTAGVVQETVEHELYQRWVQFSAFSPLFWWDGLWGLRAPWEYGNDGMETVTQFLRLRYSLLPYTYTYTRLAHETGTPLVRGTWLEYPQQEQAYAFPHQYLFGTELLVAPIVKPGKGQPMSKDVYLPEGEHWYDWFTEDIYPGGQVLPYECPLSRLPLFVRAGSILPMALDMAYSDQQVVDPLLLNIYAGKPATFRLYEDDGTSLDYRQHAYAWTPIEYRPSQTAGDHVITIGSPEGRYAGQVTERRYRLRVHGLHKPASVLVGKNLLTEKLDGDPAEGWVWHVRERVLEIELTRPRPVTAPVTVTLRKAGTFEDRLVLDRVLTYRKRVREIKIAEKLRWAMLLAGQDIKKEPHVLQVTDQVEQQLDDLVDNPSGLATRAPDFRGMTAAMLAAFVTKPFDSSRKIPELDPDAQAAMRSIANGTFTQEELYRMTAELLDCRLVASTSGGERSKLEAFTQFDTAFVTAHVLYDTAAMSTIPVVEYELILPRSGDPGWAEESRSLKPDGSVSFLVRPPFPVQQGTYWFKLRAMVTWGPNRTLVESDVPWVVPPKPQG